MTLISELIVVNGNRREILSVYSASSRLADNYYKRSDKNYESLAYFFKQCFITVIVQVISEGNVKIENVPYNTKITLSDTGRKDSGLYKIIAENDFGKDEATVEVTVLCT